MKTKPLAKFTAVSTLSANLLPSFEFKIILSTKTEISCLSFLSKLGDFSISYKTLSIFIFLNPLLLKL